jgi:hypothetical protein
MFKNSLFGEASIGKMSNFDKINGLVCQGKSIATKGYIENQRFFLGNYSGG